MLIFLQNPIKSAKAGKKEEFFPKRSKSWLLKF